jgi:hypothetical protein
MIKNTTFNKYQMPSLNNFKCFLKILHHLPLFILLLSWFLTTQTPPSLESIIIWDDSIESGKSVPMLWRNELSPTTGLKSKPSKQACKQVATTYCFLGLLFNPEDGSNTLHWMLVNFYQTTQCHIPQDSPLHSYHHKDLKPHIIISIVQSWTLSLLSN